MSLGALTFLAPWALLGLLALPLVWLVSRATPPRPRLVDFAPARFLDGLDAGDPARAATPPWLIALRMAVTALVCIALARPVIDAAPPTALEGPTFIVIDDGWASAPGWEAVRAAALRAVDAADRAGHGVALAVTAPNDGPPEPWDVLSPDAARAALAAMAPSPVAPNRAALAERLAADPPPVSQAVWASDGLDHGDGWRALGQALADLGPVRVAAPPDAAMALALSAPASDAGGVSATVARARGGRERTVSLVAYDAAGAALARGSATFARGAREAEGRIRAPLTLVNQAALIRIEDAPSAGAARALDADWGRPVVGLLDDAGGRDRQPLLTDLHYVEKALAPFAETSRGDLATLLASGAGVIVAPDAAVRPDEVVRLQRFVEDGGLLIRFAGPRLAARADTLTPTPLRIGGRRLEGGLGWDTPQTLSTFPHASPFAGLAHDPDVTVSRQVLAEPAADLPEKTWAALDDGTPLVTAAMRGEGMVVLFHVTAAPTWSSLPVSGVFPQMLRRTTAVAGRAREPVAASADAPWTLAQALTAAGRLAAPPADRARAADVVETASLATPPGVWTRPGQARALNVLPDQPRLTSLPNVIAGSPVERGAARAPAPLAGVLFALALIALCIDAAAVRLLGRPAGEAAEDPQSAKTPASSAARAASLLAAAVVASAAFYPAARAQAGDAALVDAVERLRLAYVITGDPERDRFSAAGLEGLSRALTRRTTVEPAGVVGVAPDDPALKLYPLAYWPVAAGDPPPSPEAAANVDAYLKAGGVVIFDTGDPASGALSAVRADSGLPALAEALNLPRLEPADLSTHVLGRSFYLLSDLPGRWADAGVWVEADGAASARDGVSGVIVTGADWAAAWAVDAQGRPLAALADDRPGQRERSYRAGINLVMYALTGNYKTDQVHAPALILRGPAAGVSPPDPSGALPERRDLPRSAP